MKNNLGMFQDNLLNQVIKYDIITMLFLPLWRNWQTRATQNRVRATSCRFDSDQRHDIIPSLAAVVELADTYCSGPYAQKAWRFDSSPRQFYFKSLSASGGLSRAVFNNSRLVPRNKLGDDHMPGT